MGGRRLTSTVGAAQKLNSVIVAQIRLASTHWHSLRGRLPDSVAYNIKVSTVRRPHGVAMKSASPIVELLHLYGD